MKFNRKKLSEYDTDPGAETQGIQFRFGDGIVLRLRRAGGANRVAFDRALSKHARPYQRRIRAGTMPPDELRELVVLPAYLDAVIVGWSGVEDDTGQEVPFSRANVKAFLEEFPDIFDELQEVAGNAAAYRVAELEEAAGALGES